jgi:hypothetical protein
MSSIEWYTQISRQDQTQLSIDENVNFYHREKFEKRYLLKIFVSTSVPSSKPTSFDAARRVLSDDVSEIVINVTNLIVKFSKLVKKALNILLHRTIQSTSSATCETDCIRLT